MDLTPLFDAIIVLDRSNSRHLTANYARFITVLTVKRLTVNPIGTLMHLSTECLPLFLTVMIIQNVEH